MVAQSDKDGSVHHGPKDCAGNSKCRQVSPIEVLGWSKIEIHARVRAVIVGYPPASIRGRIIRVIDRRILREPGYITAYPRTG